MPLWMRPRFRCLLRCSTPLDPQMPFIERRWKSVTLDWWFERNEVDRKLNDKPYTFQFNVTKALFSLLKRKEDSRNINISSIAGFANSGIGVSSYFGTATAQFFRNRPILYPVQPIKQYYSVVDKYLIIEYILICYLIKKFLCGKLPSSMWKDSLTISESSSYTGISMFVRIYEAKF